MKQDHIPDIVTNREKQWMRGWINKDEACFHDIMAPDFLLSSARGLLMTKAEWIEAALGPFTCQSFEWKEIKVRLYGDTAVVNALIDQKANVGEQDWGGRFMITDVWVY
jgi:hypothetical protein